MNLPKFTFYLDGYLVNEPEGWDELVTEIIRDFTIHGLLVSNKVELTFTGEGYKYLKCIDESQGFCEEVALTVYEQFSEDAPNEKIIDGIISVTDMTFLLPPLPEGCKVKCTIEDNSYFSRIKNKKDVQAYPHVAKSINDVVISAATPSYVRLFDPVTGVAPIAPILNGGTYRTMYRMYDVFKFLISFLSDGELDFESDLFNTGDAKGLFITNGKHVSSEVVLEQTDLDIGPVTFAKAIDEMYKIYNLGFMVERVNGRDRIRIEDDSYFYGQAVADTLNNATGVVKKVKTDFLYSRIKLGSTETITDVVFLSFPEAIRYLGVYEEEYHITGKCNSDALLDLVGEWVRSSNVIQYSLMNPDDSRDDKIFLVEATHVSGNQYNATQFDILGTGTLPHYYNGNLTNDKIALRFLKTLPNAIAAFLGNGDDTFFASRTAAIPFHLNANNQFINTIIRYDDDYTPPTNYDNGNNYQASASPGPTEFSYIAPTAGFYRFNSLNTSHITTLVQADRKVSVGVVAGVFTVGETVSDNAFTPNSGVLMYASGTDLYIRQTIGTTFAGTIITGASSGATGTSITGVAGVPLVVPKLTAYAIAKRYDSSNALIQTITGVIDSASSGPIDLPLFIDLGIILNQGDYVHINKYYQINQPYIDCVGYASSGMWFSCYQSVNGGGVYQTNDAEGFRPINYILEYPISYIRFKNILSQTRNKLQFNVDGVSDISGWIQDLKYNRQTTMAQITLLSTQVINKQNCITGYELEEDGGRSLREDGGKSKLE